MSVHKQRSEDRTRIGFEAQLFVAEQKHHAMILNASKRGVFAVLDKPPPRGTRIRLIIGDSVLDGQVRWRGADCCGIALKTAVEINDCLSGSNGAFSLVPEPQDLKGLRGLIRKFFG